MTRRQLALRAISVLGAGLIVLRLAGLPFASS
jgi:hypothetical protein